MTEFISLSLAEVIKSSGTAVIINSPICMSDIRGTKRINKYLIISENSFSYYLFVIILPVSFLLHGINENFGLIDLSILLKLLVLYITTAVIIAFLSKIILRDYSKAILFSFVILIIYFLFGLFKDFLETTIYLEKISRYSFLLPALFIFIILFGLFLKRSGSSFAKVRAFIQVFLLINLTVEIGFIVYNSLTRKTSDTDFGDPSHSLAKKYIPSSMRKPKIFWLVFDEYPASSSLKRVWNFHNPLDSLLQSKDFFVAGNARSNYNYTHYSLTSILDMIYLNSLSRHSIVTPRHMVKGLKSLYQTNASEILKKSGYIIENYTFYDVKDSPARGESIFVNLPESLIHFQTLWGRAKPDIGWNFSNVFPGNEARKNSHLDKIDNRYKLHLQNSMQAIKNKKPKRSPEFFMFHVMLPHEPFIYNSNGTIAYKNKFSDLKKNFIPHLEYTNSIIMRFADTILSQYKNEEIVIVIQGDHGFKFKENDPFFDTESCKIFYAVYCSDKNYRDWYDSISSVNSFRIIFNKYLQTDLPRLKDTSYNLLYRRK